MRNRKSVLFICTNNSARSQMAEGLLNALPGDRYEAFSAGTDPTSVNPCAIKALREIGIDISHHRSKSVDEFLGRKFDYVVTVCDRAKTTCPFFPGGATYMHQSFADPAGQEPLPAFRTTRDAIKEWIQQTFGGAANA